MLRKEELKYILDVESIIEELEGIKAHHQNDFTNFEKSYISIRAVERDLMIIGEAIGKLKKLNPQIPITDIDNIIGLRNLIVHSYDSVDSANLWVIIIKDLPILKKEMKDLREGNKST